MGVRGFCVIFKSAGTLLRTRGVGMSISEQGQTYNLPESGVLSEGLLVEALVLGHLVGGVHETALLVH
jgi:hypothetical protein